MDNQDYKASFDAIKYDLASVVAMLGFETYPGIDPVLRRLSELLLSQELAVDVRGVQASSHPALIALDKQCRDDVARALGLTPTAERDFAWSYLLARVKGVAVSAQTASEHGDQTDNIDHLTHCDESSCERCENLMHFYQACDACGAWGHNDSGPCTCSESSGPSDAQRLDFMLNKWRKIVCELLPHDNFEVYVEEGFMGDKRYPGVRYSGEWEQGSPEALEIQREAIDVAITSQGNEPGGEE